MNEIALIRAQLATERAHASQVAQVLAASAAGVRLAPDSPFQSAAVGYLVWVLAEFEERDQRLLDLARARADGQEPNRAGLEQAVAQPGRGREALALLEAAVAGDGDRRSHWQAFTQYFNEVWSARRARIEAQLENSAPVADWRAVSGIDADSIIEERRRYAAVRAALPNGITLPASGATP
jgi:hypothetical protein